MTKPIVVGADPTGTSRAALDWALRRAEETDTPLNIVHVVSRVAVSDDDPYLKSLIASGRSLLEDLVGAAREKAPGVRKAD